jgi:hypothetical protein
MLFYARTRGAACLDAAYFALQSHVMTVAGHAGRNSSKRISSLAVWLCAFFSPTAYFLLLVCVDRFHVAAPPEILVASLFFLIPIVALLICGRVVWLLSQTIARKIGWMLFTLVAMLLQFSVLLVIINAAIGAATGYAQ